MQVSLKWLRDYVDVDVPPAELAERLTMAGLEVDSLRRNGTGLQRGPGGQDPFPQTPSQCRSIVPL